MRGVGWEGQGQERREWGTISSFANCARTRARPPYVRRQSFNPLGIVKMKHCEVRKEEGRGEESQWEPKQKLGAVRIPSFLIIERRIRCGGSGTVARAHQMENERMVEFSHAQFVSYPSELAWLESLWRRSQGGVNDESACPGGKKEHEGSREEKRRGRRRA